MLQWRIRFIGIWYSVYYLNPRYPEDEPATGVSLPVLPVTFASTDCTHVGNVIVRLFQYVYTTGNIVCNNVKASIIAPGTLKLCPSESLGCSPSCNNGCARNPTAPPVK
eukprot:gb/GECG01005751.1/.p1 GENE.gb/GECG01005751.1/~~gb/GECG01005751.1/.p1  ORF type:complete len:109 (+),score=6.87 gb/GECG01005751.1/:1-327(+)